jgi:purine-binding chemotaxis protein CheW
MLAVAIEHGGEVYALMVDEVGDVLICDDDMRVSPPAYVAAERARLTSAYYRTMSGIIPLLDLDAVLDIKADRRSGSDRRASAHCRGDGL